jgi:hypothetical protein
MRGPIFFGAAFLGFPDLYADCATEPLISFLVSGQPRPWVRAHAETRPTASSGLGAGVPGKRVVSAYFTARVLENGTPSGPR